MPPETLASSETPALLLMRAPVGNILRRDKQTMNTEARAKVGERTRQSIVASDACYHIHDIRISLSEFAPSILCKDRYDLVLK